MDIKEMGERLGLEADEYLEMIELFLESGGSDLTSLEEAIAAGDAAGAHEASHSLKGSSGSLGLDSIFELARTIDDQDRQGNLDGLDVLVRELRQEYERLARAFADRPPID